MRRNRVAQDSWICVAGIRLPRPSSGHNSRAGCRPVRRRAVGAGRRLNGDDIMLHYNARPRPQERVGKGFRQSAGPPKALYCIKGRRLGID